MVFHVLNRGNERRTIFEDERDYAAFLRLFGQTQEAAPMRLLAYCLLNNHWHLVLWLEKDGELGLFMQRLTTAHVRRWRLHRRSVGYGHLYQGTYKSFPVQADEHFYAVCRYAERNALGANLAECAEQWQWCSPAQRLGRQGLEETARLSGWPVPRPRNWVELVGKKRAKPHFGDPFSAIHGADSQIAKRRNTMTQVMHGIVHGKIIELTQEIGVPDGQKVEVVIRPLSALPTSEPWGEGLRRSAGSLAGISGLDEDMEQILRERKTARFRELPE